MRKRLKQQRRLAARRSAMTLIVVLVAIALMSLSAYAFAELMFAERQGAWVHGRRAQARALANSGVEATMYYVALTPQEIIDRGGLYDNPPLFQGAPVVDGESPRDRGRVAIVAPNVVDGLFVGVRFGLEDQSARINLSTLLAADEANPDGARWRLLALPGMTEETADAILDWIDEDDDQRQSGAEAGYYGELQPSYGPRNGPIETLAELLMVRGVTPELLFGVDANMNYQPDAGETGEALAMQADNSDGAMNHGWAAYLTLNSAERNQRPDGTARIDLNGDDLEALFDELSAAVGEEAATFIIAYRQNGAYAGDENSQPIGSLDLDLTQEGGTQINSVLELVGAKVQVTLPNQEQPSVFESPFANEPGALADLLPALMDVATVEPAEVVAGRVNINQAPRVVLMSLPGMTEALADSIIATRVVDPTLEENSSQRHGLWPLWEGTATLDEMKALEPYVTAGGHIFGGQSVGYFEADAPSARIEFVVDATQTPPRLLLWMDRTGLGRGFTPEMLGVAPQ